MTPKEKAAQTLSSDATVAEQMPGNDSHMRMRAALSRGEHWAQMTLTEMRKRLEQPSNDVGGGRHHSPASSVASSSRGQKHGGHLKPAVEQKKRVPRHKRR